MPLDDAPLVLLLRCPDEEGEDRYVCALARHGFRAVCRPVLRFCSAGDEDFDGHDALASLHQPDRYAGLVVTSPRAGRAFSKALRAHTEARAGWKEKPAFAVGPKTAKTLRESGLEAKGEASGDAAALSSVIAGEMERRGPYERSPLLFLCGNRRRDELPRRLRAAGIAFEERVVYETYLRAGPWLSLGAERPAWAVFFSPSGVEAVRRARERGWEAVRKAALGPTTAEALREAGWSPEAVAAAPTPEALAEALAEADEHQSVA